MCIPLIWYLEKDNIFMSFIMVLLIILSDLLDGFVARHADEITNFGKLIDPVADKICIMVVIIYLIFKEGWWFLLFLGLLTIRDIMIITIGVYLMNVQDKVFQSNWAGKWFVFISSLMIISFVYHLPLMVGNILYISSIILMIVSTMQYIKRYNRYFKQLNKTDDLLV